VADQAPTLDHALERVVAAARAHLAAVRAAGGTADDAAVWRSYVALNNASGAYDRLLEEAYGEVTPWDTEPIEPAGRGAGPRLVAGPDRPVGELPPDPYPGVLSVRQRRDYRVPSGSALLAAARAGSGDRVPAPAGVAGAVLGLVGGGDGSLASLDLPELEPLSGVVTVVEVPQPLAPGTPDPALFEVAAGQRQLGRLDEQPYDLHEREDPGAGGPAAAAGPERAPGEVQ
jgi:hypothetical protein